MKKGTLRTLIFVMICLIIGAMLFNYSFLEDIVIPDPCYYHNNNYITSALFDLFYCFPSSEGGHPFPTLFNLIFTIIIGAAAGMILWWLIHRVRKPDI